MKKLALILGMSSVLALTACSKEPTEVTKGSTVPATAQKHVLTNNNAEHIKADMQALETLAMQQEAGATDLNQRLSQAVQAQDEAALQKLFPEFKAHMLNNLAEMKKLKLQSKEVTELRTKIDEIQKLSLSLQAMLIAENSDPQKMQELQAKGAQLQQEIMALSQNIEATLGVNSAQAAQAQSAEGPQDLATLEDAAPEVAE